MQPIVIDPSTYDRSAAREDSKNLIAEFCSVQGLRTPRIIESPYKKEKGPRDHGFCTHRSMYCGPGQVPAKNPGYSWSFTGYKADRTAYGIAAHELGHWFHFVAGDTSEIIREFLSVATSPKRVSGYEPNAYEKFAESTRLYVLNPELLKEACPDRFAALEALGMKTLHSAGWKEVLVHAGDKRIAALEKWIAS